MSSGKLRLYFIAVVPDDHIQFEVTAYKRLMEKSFHSSHALKSPPHITLISPLKVSDKQLVKVRSKLISISNQEKEFPVKLNGFGFFEPRVIYVHVDCSKSLAKLKYKTEEALLRAKVLLEKERRAYHPHMTIAHRDLSKTNYYKAWSFFKNQDYSRVFKASSISLLKHKNKVWEVAETFPLRKL